jgi:hypothetical protein
LSSVVETRFARRRWPTRLWWGVAAVPLLLHCTLAVLLLADSYRYYYVNEDGEAGIYGDALGHWVLGSLGIWIIAAAVLVGLWWCRRTVFRWLVLLLMLLVPVVWYVSTSAFHGLVVRSL